MATRTSTMTTRTKRTRRARRLWIPMVLAFLLIAGGAGYYYYEQTQQAAQQAQAAQTTIRTATVRRGNISVSASGTGTLVASKSQGLIFSVSGTVGSLKVQVGDSVQQGQVLAQLADMTTLQTAIDTAQQNLVSAQQALDTLKQGGPANIGNAELAVANAQKAVDTAKAGYIVPGMMRCDQPTTDAYYSTYSRLKKQLDALGNGGGNPGYYLNIIVPAQINVNKAYQAYLNCAGFTNYETDASHANLAVSLAQLKTAQDNLTLLQQNNGVNPTDLASAQNKVDNAQLALNQAKQNLDGATLKAPFDGVVTAVAGNVGDSTSASTPFITVADMIHPQIQFQVDETDLSKVAMGEAADVAFDSMPNTVFHGKIVQINPTLVQVSGYQTVQGLVQLDLGQTKTQTPLLAGMTATVQVIKASAQNVLLVPNSAVRDLGSGQFGVFVVGPQDKLSLHFVQVGLSDTTNTEIKSGLNPGEVISTGATATRSQ